MNSKIKLTLAVLAGVAIGATAIQGLHAQAKPPVYQIVEIDVLNQEVYVKDYAPKAQAAIRASGGKFLAAGGKTTSIEGDPPKTRVTIQIWDSMEKMKAAYESADYKEARKIGDKYAKFRAFAVEGLPQ